MYNYLYGFLAQISVILIPLGFVSFILYRHRKKQKYSPFTEKFLRPPGSSLDTKLDNLLDKMFFPVMLICILPYVCLTQLPSYTNTSGKFISVIVCVIACIYCLFKLRSTFNESVSVRLGLEGEMYTGGELNYLMRDGAWVYHDIPYQYGNIDHIIVSTGGVFAVETKAVRKPAKEGGRAEHKVTIEGEKLIFPHVTTKKPIQQAQVHANYLNDKINRMTGIKLSVTAVVALPGWYVNSENKGSNVLVMNPKRGTFLRPKVLKKVLSDTETALIAEHIESFARNIESRSDITDPDGKLKYDLFNNRRPTEKKL